MVSDLLAGSARSVQELQANQSVARNSVETNQKSAWKDCWRTWWTLSRTFRWTAVQSLHYTDWKPCYQIPSLYIQVNHSTCIYYNYLNCFPIFPSSFNFLMTFSIDVGSSVRLFAVYLPSNSVMQMWCIRSVSALTVIRYSPWIIKVFENKKN